VDLGQLDKGQELLHRSSCSLQARLEDPTIWQMEKVKQSRKGSKTYTYWISIPGSARKMDPEAARQKQER